MPTTTGALRLRRRLVATLRAARDVAAGEPLSRAWVEPEAPLEERAAALAALGLVRPTLFYFTGSFGFLSFLLTRLTLHRLPLHAAAVQLRPLRA
jgi:type VI protein secretion system component VasF